jgi:hypothetical protein
MADYQAAKAAAQGVPPAALFPTAKVIGGYDFTGEVWPNGPLAADPNPIDLAGHGSATADVLGGKSLDNVHKGVAPGTQLYAVKVCSSVSTACSGVAILQGLDFALDPDNTGTLNNPVDLISMSVGSSFGQREDDDSESFTDLVNFGIMSVVSAGNDGNIPYIIAGPAATPEVLALAATASVTETGIPLVINAPPAIAGTYTNTATLDWAPVNTTVSGSVVYVGRGCPGDVLLANPAGKIALVDRGTCAVSLKVDYVANAGAIGSLIGLVAAGDAISFSNGGGTLFVPSLVITQSTSNLIKNQATAGVTATISPANSIPLNSSIANFSSRGPNYSYNMLKPDMSAPGTVSAANVGTGNGEAVVTGTSFSCPMTGGAAALLLSKNPALTPLDVKALLMETAEVNVALNPLTQPGVLAPMSRMGSGEVRANLAAAATTEVWDTSAPLAVSISFGTYRLNTNQSFKKKLVIKNSSNSARTYLITNTTRNAPNTTGVTLSFPSSVFVAANSSTSIALTLTVNAAALPTWTLNGGSNGNNGALLETLEYAGFLTFTGSGDTVHIPWHILPHKAANVQPASSSLSLGGNPVNLNMTNTSGLVAGSVSVFSLTGTSPQLPSSALPAPGSDFEVIDLKAVGVRPICADANCATFAVQFAVTTFGQRAHPDVPAEFDIYLDVNKDGTNDLVIFNGDIGLLTTGFNSGQNGVFVADLTNNTARGPYSFTSADLNSANAILTVPLSALVTSTGLRLGISTPFSFSILAFDNYFTGNLTDLIGPMLYELDMPSSYAGDLTVPANGAAPLTVFPNNAANVFFTGPYNGNSPSQTGLLLMYLDGKTGQETSSITVTP